MLVGEAESLGPGEEKLPGLAGLIRNLELDPSHRQALVSDSARGSLGPSCQVTYETSLFAAHGFSTWLNSGGQRCSSGANYSTSLVGLKMLLMMVKTCTRTGEGCRVYWRGVPPGRICQEAFFSLNGRNRKASIWRLCRIIKDADAKDSLIRFFNY